MTSILDLINANSEESTKVEYAPYIQFVGVKDSKKPADYGLFISEDNADAVGWTVPEGCKIWKQKTHTLGSGTQIKGWISQQPRIIILKSSPLSMFSKETGRFIGEYDDKSYKENKDKLVLKTKHAVILLDENKNALHKGSLIYNPKSMSGATFGVLYNEFRKEYQKVIKQTRQDPFWVNVVYSPKAGWKLTAANYVVGCYTGYKFPSIDTPEEQAEMINDFILKTDPVYEQIKEEYAIYKNGLSYRTATTDDEEYTPVEAPKAQEKPKPVDFSKMLQGMMDGSLLTDEDEIAARESITKDEPLENLEAQRNAGEEPDPDDIPF